MGYSVKTPMTVFTELGAWEVLKWIWESQEIPNNKNKPVGGKKPIKYNGGITPDFNLYYENS